MAEPSLIEQYLRQLESLLHVDARLAARILDEARDHLLTHLQRELDAGVSPAEAEGRAIARFGPPQQVAASFREVPALLLAPRLIGAGLLLCCAYYLGYYLLRRQSPWPVIQAGALLWASLALLLLRRPAATRRGWFRVARTLGLFYPAAWQGWLLTLIGLGSCLTAFVASDLNSHSVSDTFLRALPLLALLGAVYVRVAYARGGGSLILEP
jgi:hypothetical protein